MGSKKIVWVMLLVLAVGIAGWGVLKPRDSVPGVEETVNIAPRASEALALAESSPSAGPTGDPVKALLPAQKLNAADSRKISILRELIQTRNDNDPRMDTELRNLSAAAKAEIQSIYRDTKPESRNERGTMVFLLGREIRDPAELSFFRGVLQEKPCLSLENCERPAGAVSGDEEHLETINDTTASYPQLIALRALVHRANELKEASQEGSALFSGILDTLREARNSPNPKIADAAQSAVKELSNE